MIFSATRLAALVFVVALGGSLALVAESLPPGTVTPGAPASEAPGLEAAGRFSGVGTVVIIENGERAEIDGVPYMQGQVSAMRPDTIEVDDPRMAGTQQFTQHAADFGSFGPTWGEMRIEDEDGAWVGEVSGLWGGGSTEFSGWLNGEGAYDGLVEYIVFEAGGPRVSFSGVIYPADAPPLELESE